MWTVSKQDFDEIDSWGLERDPFAAVADYSELKRELRWLNPEHRDSFVEYIYKRMEYIGGKNFDDYYKRAQKPIDRERWDYLKRRKAWFIMPLGWNRMADQSCRVTDLGCGDGDTVQRLIEFIDGEWKKMSVSDRRVHIVGLDLNASRVENARKLVTSPNPNITFEFHTADIVGEGLGYGDRSFEFALCTGVLEILEDQPCMRFLDEICRVAGRGIYIEDLFEKFPGGYPRENLGELLETRGFRIRNRRVVLSEPFDVARLRDPKRLWPVMVDQNIWAERE